MLETFNLANLIYLVKAREFKIKGIQAFNVVSALSRNDGQQTCH